ncbi:hypothetical protein PLICRDRAFT_658316 [Plicaturopsis crispa FD-325 SS-3]|nr:hypothetical protein PLICRDRAFT_658316 [Plicaturopsis crispa FD-325 SS-3]
MLLCRLLALRAYAYGLLRRHKNPFLAMLGILRLANFGKGTNQIVIVLLRRSQRARGACIFRSRRDSLIPATRPAQTLVLRPHCMLCFNASSLRTITTYHFLVATAYNAQSHLARVVVIMPSHNPAPSCAQHISLILSPFFDPLYSVAHTIPSSRTAHPCPDSRLSAQFRMSSRCCFRVSSRCTASVREPAYSVQALGLRLSAPKAADRMPFVCLHLLRPGSVSAAPPGVAMHVPCSRSTLIRPRSHISPPSVSRRRNTSLFSPVTLNSFSPVTPNLPSTCLHIRARLLISVSSCLLVALSCLSVALSCLSVALSCLSVALSCPL